MNISNLFYLKQDFVNTTIHMIFYLIMLESFKEALDNGNSVSAIFMDLSKVFNTLNHDLLIAKLEVHYST